MCGPSLHRDVKPGNILLQDGHALLADFGIGRAVDPETTTELTRTGMLLGTPAYASPEHLGGRLRRRPVGPLLPGVRAVRDAGRLRALPYTVYSRRMMMEFQGTTLSAEDITAEVGASHVVDATLSVAGGAARIDVGAL